MMDRGQSNQSRVDCLLKSSQLWKSICMTPFDVFGLPAMKPNHKQLPKEKPAL